MAERDRRLRDLAALNVLAHPLRLRIYYALQIQGELTATSLAQQLAGSVQLISYHLDQLAKHGFIEPVLTGHEGDKRQRWWRASDASVTWASSDFLDAPSSAETADTARRAMLAYHLEQAQKYLSTERTWPATWVDAAFSDDAILRLTHDQLQALHEDLTTIIRRHRDAGDPPAGEARSVFLFLHGFPLPHQR